MDTLLNLLGVEAERGMTLSHWEWDVGATFPLWLAIVIFAFGVVWAALVYTFEKGTIGWVRRPIGILLRSTVIAIILFLLLEPVIRLEYTTERERPIALLLDNSQSLNQQDRRVTVEDKARALIALDLLSPSADLASDETKKDVARLYKDDASRLALLQAALKNPKLNLVDGIGRQGPVRPLLFGARLHGLDDDKTRKDAPLTDRLLAAVKADEAKTTLADSLMEVYERKDADLPAALVLFTDGVDPHSKRTLADVSKEIATLNRKRVHEGGEPIPVHVVGLGTAKAGMLRLRDVQLPDTLFTEDLVTLPLHYKAQGLGKGTLEVTAKLGDKTLLLKRGGKHVETLELGTRDGEDLRDTLTFEVPKGEAAEGLKDLAISIKLRGDKKYEDSFTGKVRVADDKIKVLYIETSPRFQYKFLVQALLRDRRIEPKFLLIKADKEATRTGPYLSEFPPTRKDFFDAKFNVIILGDVAPKVGDKGFLTTEQMEWIKDFVKARGGLIAIAGRDAMPAAYAGTPLEEVLPVVTSGRVKKADPDLRTPEYPPTLTEIGLRRAGMLALADTPEENQKVWQELHGFFWYHPIDKLRAGAEALLINPRAKMGDEPMPILATHYYSDQGQVVFLGSDETWRWRYNVEDKYFARFWGQMIMELGRPSLGKNDRLASLELGGGEAVLDKETRIFARLLDKDFQPLKDKEVTGTLKFIEPGAKKASVSTVKFFLQKTGGRYLASFNPDKPGRYELTLSHPENTTFSFRVDPPKDHELQPTPLNEEGLRNLARDSGGQYYREEDLRYLPDALKGQKITSTVRREILFWNWMVFAALLLALTGEWLLRKFSNLS